MSATASTRFMPPKAFRAWVYNQILDGVQRQLRDLSEQLHRVDDLRDLDEHLHPVDDLRGVDSLDGADDLDEKHQVG
jgi:hypothetical protein